MVAFIGTSSFLWTAFTLASSSSFFRQPDGQSSQQKIKPSSSLPSKNFKEEKHKGGILRINRALRATHSRREVNKFISAGRISRNGRVVTNPDTKLKVGDIVKLDNQVIKWEEKDLQPHRYLKYNKPRGIICTTDKRTSNNIIDAIEYETAEKYINISDDINDGGGGGNFTMSSKRRIYPIGRLDAESTGLILLTSDGNIVNPLLRGDDKDKEYHVVTSPRATDEQIKNLSEGVVITTLARKDGSKGVPVTERTLPCIVERIERQKDDNNDNKKCNLTPELLKNNTTTSLLRFVLKEGRNRQIRKMCSIMNLEVISLHRVNFAGITLDKIEKSGQFAELLQEELALIGIKDRPKRRRTSEEKAKRKLKKIMKKIGK